MSMMIQPARFVGGVSANARALIYRTTQTSVITDIEGVPFQAELYDTDSFYTFGTSAIDLIVPITGLYRVIANAQVFGATGLYQRIRKNGGAFAGAGHGMTPSGVGSVNLASGVVALTVGDAMRLEHTSTSDSIYAYAGAGVADPYFTWLAIERLPNTLKYALVTKSVDQDIPSANTDTAVTWDAETADTDGFHSTSSNTDRMTVPSGVTLVRLTANLTTSVYADQFFARLTKNGVSDTIGLPSRDKDSSVNKWMSLVSAPVEVTTSDYFSVIAQVQTAGGDLTTSSSFCIEEVPASTKRALVYQSSGQVVGSAGFATATFNSEVYDTDAMHDTVTNNSRLTVPAGCTQARVTFNAATSASITGVFEAVVTKNGGDFTGAPRDMSDTAGTDQVNGCSGWLDVTPGDYFELLVKNASSGFTFNAARTWFCLECRP